MSKYRIKMDGVVYEMEIEKIDGEVKTAQAAVKTETVQKTAPAAVNTVSTPVKENKTTVSAPAGNGAVVVSPMPGTILKINYHNGDAVKKNDTLMILEAMKMENEIVAPQDGVVSGLAVEEKTSVQGGDVLFTVI